MQTEFTIEYEDDLDKFTCEIGQTIRCSLFVRDLLDDICNLFGYKYEEQYSESHYKVALEQDLGISIKFNFDY